MKFLTKASTGFLISFILAIIVVTQQKFLLEVADCLINLECCKSNVINKDLDFHQKVFKASASIPTQEAFEPAYVYMNPNKSEVAHRMDDEREVSSKVINKPVKVNITKPPQWEQKHSWWDKINPFNYVNYNFMH